MLGLWWIVAASIIAGCLVITILGQITKSKIETVVDIQSTIKSKDLYAKITSVQSDTVKFSMYDRNGNHVQDAKMTSTFSDVSSRVRVGDRIN